MALSHTAVISCHGNVEHRFVGAAVCKIWRGETKGEEIIYQRRDLRYQAGRGTCPESQKGHGSIKKDISHTHTLVSVIMQTDQRIRSQFLNLTTHTSAVTLLWYKQHLFHSEDASQVHKNKFSSKFNYTYRFKIIELLAGSVFRHSFSFFFPPPSLSACAISLSRTLSLLIWGSIHKILGNFANPSITQPVTVLTDCRLRGI